jgi:uncharacterized protein
LPGHFCVVTASQADYLARVLSERPWKLQALMRLGGSVVVCVVLGQLAQQVINWHEGPRTANPLLFFGSIAVAAGMLAGALIIFHKPWSIPELTTKLSLAMVLGYGGMMLGWWSGHLLGKTVGDDSASFSSLVISLLSLHGAALVLAHYFLREHGLGWAAAFGFSERTARAVGMGAVGCLIALPAMGVLQAFSIAVMQRFNREPQTQDPVEVVSQIHSWPAGILLAVLSLVLAPVVEEILFRGILYPAIKRKGHPRLAFWGTAILFGAIHANLMAFLPLTFLAILLTWLYERTGNLLAPVTTHGLFNAINFAALIASQHPEWGPFFDKVHRWIVR